MSLRAVLLGTTLLALALPVAAQEAVEDWDNEEIIVTAQRRSQKSQEVPLALTAMDERAIERMATIG